MTNMSIQPLWLTHFIEILLVLEFKITKFIVGAFFNKAHFRPQISSNGRCYSSPGVGSTCQFSSSYKSSQDDSPYYVCALAHFSFILLLLGVLLGALGILLRLWLVSLLLRWIFSFFLSFWIHLWISSNQSLVFGRFDGAHHHQFILLLGEGFHELNKIRNIPGSSCQFSGIEGQNKHWIFRAKLWEYGKK